MSTAEEMARDLNQLVELMNQIEALPPAADSLAAERRARHVARLKAVTLLFTDTNTQAQKKPSFEATALIQTQILLALELADGILERAAEGRG